MKRIYLAILLFPLVLALIPQVRAVDIDPAVGTPLQWWVEAGGFLHHGPLIPIFRNALNGEGPYSALAEKITVAAGPDGVLSEDEYRNLVVELVKGAAGLRTLPECPDEAACVRISRQFQADFIKAKNEAAGDGTRLGSIRGIVYRLRPISELEKSNPIFDSVYLIPADPLFHNAIRRNQVEQAQKDLKAEFEVEFKAQAAKDKELKKEYELFNTTRTLLPNSKAMGIFKSMRRQYEVDGRFNSYNLTHVVKDYLANGLLKDQVIVVTPNDEGHFSRLGMVPGEWLIYSNQRVISYLYQVCLEPGKECSVEMFRAFDERMFTP